MAMATTPQPSSTRPLGTPAASPTNRIPRRASIREIYQLRLKLQQDPRLGKIVRIFGRAMDRSKLNSKFSGNADSERAVSIKKAKDVTKKDKTLTDLLLKHRTTISRRHVLPAFAGEKEFDTFDRFRVHAERYGFMSSAWLHHEDLGNIDSNDLLRSLGEHHRVANSLDRTARDFQAVQGPAASLWRAKHRSDRELRGFIEAYDASVESVTGSPHLYANIPRTDYLY
eukprot:g4633.t1